MRSGPVGGTSADAVSEAGEAGADDSAAAVCAVGFGVTAGAAAAPPPEPLRACARHRKEQRAQSAQVERVALAEVGDIEGVEIKELDLGLNEETEEENIESTEE